MHVVDKDDKQLRLWLLAVATDEAKALTDPKWEVSDLAWYRPADHYRIISATDRPESDQETHRIFSVALSNGARTLLLAPHGPFGELRVSPDGRTVSYVGCRVDGPAPHDLMLLDIGKRATRNLTGASLDRAIHEHRWIKDGSLLALYADGFRNKLVGFSPEGMSKNPANPPAGNVSGFAASDSGDVVFVGQSATTPPELAWTEKFAKTGFSPQRLLKCSRSARPSSTNTNHSTVLRSKPRAEGLYADPKAKLPLIALIHGGPTGNW